MSGALEMADSHLSCSTTFSTSTFNDTTRLGMHFYHVMATAHYTISVARLTNFVSEITKRVYFTCAVLFQIQSRSVVRPKSYSVRWPLLYLTFMLYVDVVKCVMEKCNPL